MKIIITKIIFFLILLCFNIGNTFSQTFCLQMTEVSNDGKNLIVKVEIQANGEFSLADANLQFLYDGNSLGVPQFGSSDLAPPTYYVPTISTPAPETGSVNIVLPFPGSGTKVPNSPNWLELIQISFPIIDGSSPTPIKWQYTGGTIQTVVFNDGPNFPVQIFAEADCLSGYTPANK